MVYSQGTLQLVLKSRLSRASVPPSNRLPTLSLARGLCPRWPCNPLAEYISFLGVQSNIVAEAV